MVRHDPVRISGLTLSIDIHTLFAGFDAAIACGDRIALIGNNGTGKSTLLRCLDGQIAPADGTIHMPANVRVGYLPQKMTLEEGKTVWEIATQPVQPIIDDLKRFESVAGQIGESPEAEEEYNDLLDRLMACNGFIIEAEIEKLLARAGLGSYHAARVSELSGGQQRLLGLIRVLASDPNLLLLDEPTNHLDRTNLAQLLELLQGWRGSAIVVSHNMQLLRSWPTCIWEIHEQTVTVFDGSYDDFVREKAIRENQLVEKLETLKKEKRKLTRAMQEEKKRAAQSRRKGRKKYKDGPKIVRETKKRQAEKTAGRLTSAIGEKQEQVSEQLWQITLPKKIVPRFELPAAPAGKPSIHIQDGSVGYSDTIINSDTIIIGEITLLITAGERVALMGDNGSGKSTLVRAIMHDPSVVRHGEWLCPPSDRIGYLDQHYSSLNPQATAYETIKNARPEWRTHEVRTFLNDFLFRTNEEVSKPVHVMSGGEMARLTLAQIAARSPMLLILDEVTNNLDMTTRQHIIDVLGAYPGTIIAISHDDDFLQKIGVTYGYEIKNQRLLPKELPWL